MNIVRNFDYWRAVLAGQKVQHEDGNVYLGYWRFKPKNHQNGGDPVAIYADGDSVVCMIGQRVVENHSNVFNTTDDNKVHYTLADLTNWICKNPVSYEDYSAVVDTGNWPNMHAAVSEQIANETAGIGHNSQPMGKFEELRDQIDALSGEVIKALKKGAAKTQQEADAVGDLATRLGTLHGKADKERTIEKYPFLEKCREIDDKWRPLTESAGVYKDVKQTCITPFLAELKRKRDAAAAEAAAEAARIQREADEAARQAEEAARHAPIDDPNSAAEVSEAAKQADLLKEQAAASLAEAQRIATQKISAGTRGRSISLRPSTEYTVTDRRAAFAALMDHAGFIADIDAVILKHAKPIIAAGTPVAGVGTEAKQNAA